MRDSGDAARRTTRLTSGSATASDKVAYNYNPEKGQGEQFVNLARSFDPPSQELTLLSLLGIVLTARALENWRRDALGFRGRVRLLQAAGEARDLLQQGEARVS